MIGVEMSSNSDDGRSILETVTAETVITVRSPALTFQTQDRDGILTMPLLRVERDHRSQLQSPRSERGGHERLDVERT
jgi:hypothetical protein